MGEAGKIEADAAKQGEFRRLRCRSNLLAVEAREDEVVHGVPHPGAIAHGGHGGTLNFLERPVRGARSPLDALIDPGAQQSYFFRGEMGAHRRHEFLTDSCDEADEAALGALAGDNVHTGGAALERGFLLIQPQAAHLLLTAMACQAALGQQRLDIAGKFNLGFGRGR